MPPSARSKKSKKIVLYSPQQASAEAGALAGKEHLPLSLLQIAGLPVERGFDVVIIDGNLYEQDEAHRRVVEACADALIYGTTGILGYQVADAFLCSSKVKAAHPDLASIIGGWFASAAPELELRTGLYDAVALGQGELTFMEFVEAVESGADLEEVPGLALLREDALIRTSKRDIVGWDQLVRNPWHLIDFDEYRRQQLAQFGTRLSERLPRPPWIEHPKKFVGITYFSSYGCPEKCAFCCSPEVAGIRWKASPADRMLDDLQDLHERWGFDNVGFYDANWGVFERRAKEFAAGMLERDLRFGYYATMQTYSILRYKEETLDLLAASGLYAANVGGETGSQEMVDRIQKKIQLGDDLAAAELLDKRGILTWMGFIIGYPGESEESMHLTLDRARELRRRLEHSRAQVWPFVPIPATAFWEPSLAEGFQPPESLLDWGDFESYSRNPVWRDRIPARIAKRRELFMHFATLTEGAARGKIGFWERSAKRWMGHGRYRHGLVEAKAFTAVHRVERRLRTFLGGEGLQAGRYRKPVPAPWERDDRVNSRSPAAV